MRQIYTVFCSTISNPTNSAQEFPFSTLSTTLVIFLSLIWGFISTFVLLRENFLKDWDQIGLYIKRLFCKILLDHIVLFLTSYQIIAIERICAFSYVCLIKLTSFCFYEVCKLPTVLMWDLEDKKAFFLLLKIFSFFFPLLLLF